MSERHLGEPPQALLPLRIILLCAGTRVLYASVEFWTWWFFLLSDNRTGKLLRKNLVFTSPHFFNTSPPKWAFGKKTSFFLTNRISSALHHPFPVTPFSGSCKKRFPRPRKWLLVSLHVTGNNSQFFWTCWKILRTPTIQDLRLCGEIVCQIFLIGGLP